MIDIASRATDGVLIPGRKVTQKHIIDLFESNLKNLRERLSVSAVSDFHFRGSTYLVQSLERPHG